MAFYTDSGREIHYYGEEFGESMHSGAEGDPVATLNDLFVVLLQSWARETAYPSAQKDPQYCRENDPTYGQCAMTAVVAYEHFGGTIHRIRVPGGGTHYFNKISGHSIDLTSDQFSLYRIPCSYEPNEQMDPACCGRSRDTGRRLKLLKSNIAKALSEGDA